jgi:uncharacterized cupredoxin-like copper-binding protein
MSHRFIAIVSSLVIVIALAGCAAATPTPPAEPERVEVTLTEFGVEASQTEFEAGQPYEFVITNEGAINHEFRLIPTSSDHGHSDEEHDTALLVVPENELEVGETVTVNYTFTDEAAHSEIEISCHIAGHYEAGMKLPISVSN